jgi:hypothetical protein
MRWVLIAFLGLAVAAVVSLSASSLTSQPVGLSSEPLTAGDQLAPRRTATRTVTVPAKRTRPRATQTTPSVPTTAAPTPTTAAPPPPVATTDDHGGRRSGSDDSGGHGSDD